MGKSKRLVELMMAVNRKRTFTVRELALEFGVSTRTILRDLRELEDLGVPLYSELGAHGGYRVLNQRMLPPIAFTEDDAVAMFFACHALRHYASLPFAAETSLELEKFYEHLPDDVRARIDQLRNRFDIVTPRRQAVSPYLPIMLEAAVAQQVVTIEYATRSERVRHDIQPLGIYAQNGFWYCPAYCFRREDYRVFRCDRIQKVYADAEAARPEPLDLRAVHLGNCTSIARKTAPTVRLEVELTSEGVHQCEALSYALPILHVREDGSGWLEGKVAEADVPFLARTLIGMGQDATVKKPQVLMDEMKRMLNVNEMLAVYA